MSNLRERAEELRKTMRCNCDLNNWVPEPDTGHSWVCRIHRKLKGQGDLRDERTREEREYDSYVTSARWDSDDDPGEPEGCSCHINPPCSYCTSQEVDDE